MKKKLLFTLLISATLYSQEPVNPGLQRYLTRIAAETAEIPNQLPEQGISNLLETARDKLKEARTYKEYRSFLTRAPQSLQETLAENPQHAGNPKINIFVRCI